MTHSRTLFLTLALLWGIGATWRAFADDEKPKVEAAAATAGAKETHTVVKGRFRVTVALEGIFVPQRMAEMALRPETATELTVAEAVEHGHAVKKGDTLVRLDRRRIDQEIRDDEAERKQARLAIEQLQAEIRVLEPNLPKDLAMAGRAKKNADSDLDNFVTTGRELTKQSAELEVKSIQTMVDYFKDELDQLEKMYKSDDLTEETEELILKRQRNQLEFAQAYLEVAKTHRDNVMRFQLPRQEADLRENVERQSQALDKTRATLPLSLTKLKLDLEKQKYDLAKSGEKLEKLKRDAGLLNVTSPADGAAYYGSFTNGEWSGASSMTGKLKRGGSISPHEVFITVVELHPLSVRVSVPEKDLHWLSSGMACQITPTANPAVRLPASIESIATIPSADGKFSAVLKLADENPQTDKLRPVPGLKCTAKAIAYDKSDVLSIPIKALQSDEFDEQLQYVNLVDKEGKHSRRDVTVGQRSDTTVEITGGLAEGDKILADKPHEEKKG
jgi:HlyD family secretion protein